MGVVYGCFLFDFEDDIIANVKNALVYDSRSDRNEHCWLALPSLLVSHKNPNVESQGHDGRSEFLVSSNYTFPFQAVVQNFLAVSYAHQDSAQLGPICKTLGPTPRKKPRIPDERAMER